MLVTHAQAFALLGSGLSFRTLAGRAWDVPRIRHLLTHPLFEGNVMEIAYAAGVFDGEGMVRITRWQKPNSVHVRYQVYAAIAMTHGPLVRSFQEQFGGSLHFQARSARNPNWRDIHSWNVVSQDAALFLRAIRPFLTVKAGEVDTALELQTRIDALDMRTLKGKSTPREAEMACRDVLFQRIRDLKHRSFPSLTGC